MFNELLNAEHSCSTMPRVRKHCNTSGMIESSMIIYKNRSQEDGKCYALNYSRTACGDGFSF